MTDGVSFATTQVEWIQIVVDTQPSALHAQSRTFCYHSLVCTRVCSRSMRFLTAPVERYCAILVPGQPPSACREARTCLPTSFWQIWPRTLVLLTKLCNLTCVLATEQHPARRTWSEPCDRPANSTDNEWHHWIVRAHFSVNVPLELQPVNPHNTCSQTIGFFHVPSAQCETRWRASHDPIRKCRTRLLVLSLLRASRVRCVNSTRLDLLWTPGSAWQVMDFVCFFLFQA